MRQTRSKASRGLLQGKRLHVVIYGKVQGVFYRDFARTHAKELGLTGYVQNVSDSLEVIAEGQEDKLNEFLDKLKEGPQAAEIIKVEHSFEEETNEFEDFVVKY